jgi:adenosylcobalamin-dependent ribonucleoside-triphosphate reductase
VEHLSFRLSDDFCKKYHRREVKWGFPIGGGNTLGELTFLSKYSRLKANGQKERWHETCRRVIEGYYSILHDHCTYNRTPWNAQKAQRSAEDAYDRMFNFKWLPPGRGIWMMGTPFVKEHGSAALQNCAFISTEKLGPRNSTRPFCRLMEMSMLGIGVGFDTLGAGKLTITKPGRQFETTMIEDSREGWVDSVDRLLRAYFTTAPMPLYDYSEIRPAGSPIKGFGGTAAGPGPLKRLHDEFRLLFDNRDGQEITVTDITDVMNLIGKCVVAGNVRRSAEIALGAVDDQEFLDLKNIEVNPKRCGPDGWAFMSNNSVITAVGTDHDHLVEPIATNGEPGLLFLDLARSHGRLADPPTNADYRVKGVNPCAEQSLEDQECCTLVETFPTNCDDEADFLKTLKHAYLYAKAVTLLPTHWPETNEVMQRNRRIGCSVSGVAQFADTHDWTELRKWLDAGYAEVKRRDHAYSEWLGVRESIKTTSVKPSGTVSLLAGVWPGVHWPEETVYYRRMRYRQDETILKVISAAGYHLEPDVMDPTNTVVATFPTMGPVWSGARATREVSVWEKVALAALVQRHWADNQVSATFTFRDDERDQIGPLLRGFDGQLKSMSFLPMLEGGAYEQMPYEGISQETYLQDNDHIERLQLSEIYRHGDEAEGERFCSNDTCEI